MGRVGNGPTRWLLLIGLLLGLAAAPPHQEDAPPPAEETEIPFVPPVWLSPTPDETGAIIVIVEPGDSMWAIAARAGLSLQQLLALNGLTEQSVINPGDALIIGYATPEFTATEVITPAATLPPPTPRPTETPVESALCLLAFDDLNRNGVQDAGEPLRAGVAFTLYTTQAVAANYITDGRSEPKCLRGLVPGEYRITRSVTPGEILTTGGDWTLTLTAGSELHQAFGSFIGETPVPTTAPSAAPSPAPPTPTVAPAFSSGGNFTLRLVGVVALFMGGLILLGAVLILLFRQWLGVIRDSGPRDVPADDTPPSGERRFRNLDDLE